VATNTPDELISVRQAAAECGRNPETIRRWIWSGKLPAEKLGNQLFVKRIALESYCRETAGAPDEAAAREARGTGSGVETESRAAVNSPQQDNFSSQVAAPTNITALTRPRTALQPGSRAETIKKMRRLREEIRARAGNLDVESTSDELRRDR